MRNTHESVLKTKAKTYNLSEKHQNLLVKFYNLKIKFRRRTEKFSSIIETNLKILRSLFFKLVFLKFATCIRFLISPFVNKFTKYLVYLQRIELWISTEKFHRQQLVCLTLPEKNAKFQILFAGFDIFGERNSIVQYQIWKNINSHIV